MLPLKFTARRGRRILVWSVAAFAAVQLALTLTLEWCRPHRNDPEYEIRAALLAIAQHAEPDRPLLLVVGSSRFVTAFRPECMAPLRTAAGEEPLVFNFSHLGAGPFVNLIEIQRLLAQGVRPRWLVMEILPAYLTFDGNTPATGITATRDLGHLHRYRHRLNAGKLYGRWLLARLLPCCKNRAALCHLLGPWLLPEPPPFCHELGGYCEEDEDAEPDLALAETRITDIRDRYSDILRNFCIDPDADAALREAIVAAQQAGAQVVLMMNPESSEFRSWYAADAETRLDDYCCELSATYGVAVVDARDWLPDREFMDGHHLIGAAAKRYTAQLAERVLQPLVEGRLHGVIRPAPLP